MPNMLSKGGGPRQPSGTTITAKLEESEELSFRQALRILRKRYREILGAMFVAGLAAMIISSLLTPYYASTATIEIARDSSNPLDASDLGALASSLGGSDDVKTQLTTEMNVLQNSKLLDEVMDHLGFAKRHPLKASWYKSKSYKERLRHEAGLPLSQAPITRTILEGIFSKSLTVTNIPDTRLLTIEFDDPDPQYAADVSNYLVRRFIDDHLDTRNNDAIDATHWMETQLQSLNDDVTQAQKKLGDYEMQSGLVAVPPSPSVGASSGGAAGQVQDIRLQRLMAIDQQYVQVEANRVIKEAMYRICETRNPDAIANMLGSGVIGASDTSQQVIFTGLMNMRSQESALKVQIASVIDEYGPNNPHLVSLNTQLDNLHHQETQEMNRILGQMKGDYDLAVHAEADMKSELDKAMKDASAANDAQIHLAVLEQQAESTGMLYQDLYTKLKEAQLSAGTQSSNVDVITPALAAPTPVRPKVPVYTAIGAGAGLLLGILGAFVVENLDDSLVSSTQVEEITGHSVLGIVPDFKIVSDREEGGLEPKGLRNWLAVSPRSPMAEAYRSIRTSLLLSQAGAPPRTILMSSCLPSEGKSTTAYNLACALAMMGKRVLAIDADMRKPALFRFAQIPNRQGLSTVLTSDIDVESIVVQASSVEGLSFLTSGPVPPNPSELLGSQRFRDVLNDVSNKYDFVLIDSPPMMSVTDALMLAPLVEGVLVVVRSGSTSKVLLQRVTTSISRTGANLLGYVLNGVDTRSVDYYYYNGYYYKEDYYGESK